MQFWLRRGEGFPHIVSPKGLERIERNGTMPYEHMDIEYGLGNYGDVAHPVKGRGHDGGLPGFLSCLRYFPELGTGYVMLLNSTASRAAYVEIRRLLFAYLTRDRTLPLPDEPPVAAPKPDGFYQFASPRHALFGFLETAADSQSSSEELPPDRYVPEPLPPLRRPAVPALLGWIGIGYAIVIVLAATFGLRFPAWAGWIAVGSFVGGFGILMTRLPRERPPDAGDGAVL